MSSGINPATLGMGTALAQKTQQANQAALTAQQMALNAANAAAANAAAISAIQSSPAIGLTMLSSPVVYTVADLVFDALWHVLTIPGVPSSATFLYIGGYATNQGSTGGGVDNARQKLLLSPNSGTTSVLVSYTNGVGGNYENDAPIGPCFVQCAGSKLYYKWSAAITDMNLVIFGYI